MATEAYPVEAKKYDREADKEGFFKVFKEFDLDGSGAVDTDELTKMVESLGVVMKPAELKGLVDAADEDKSGEIEFDEFVQVMNAAAAQGATTSSGQSFAQLIKKQRDSVKMEWPADQSKGGGKVTVDKAAGTASATMGEGEYVVAVLEPWLCSGRSNYNTGNVVLEVETDGVMWVGVVGKNFNPAGAHWNQAFFAADNEKKNIVTAYSSDGDMFINARSNGKEVAFGKSDDARRIGLEMNMDNYTLDVNVLKKDGSVRAGPIQLEGIKNEVAVAVCFGPGTGSAKVVGSSCEKAERKFRRASRDTWDEDNTAGINDKPAGGVGSAELFT